MSERTSGAGDERALLRVKSWGRSLSAPTFVHSRLCRTIDTRAAYPNHDGINRADR